ncbi:MAG TPA: glutamate racemase [Pseudomonadales bacterium]|nr:glutamate racemase [Pseudomonadales bacterium]
MARILVFDSGVGGLTILSAIQKNIDIRQSTHQWIFCSDNAFFPYGTKKDAELIDRVTYVLRALQNQYQPDIIVLACNTASTVALEAVRAKLRVPVVGVVPAIKPSAAVSQSRCIGLLATPATIARPYTQKLIDDFAPDCHFVRIGSSELVWMAEEHLRTGLVDHAQLYRILAPFRDGIMHHNLDTVVLACTHFPLLRPALREQLPEVKHWIDSGEGIAKRVAWCLQNEVDAKPTTGDPVSFALFTRLDNNAQQLARALSYFRLGEIRPLELPLTDL